MNNTEDNLNDSALDRFLNWLWQMFLCFDQLLGCWIRGWAYVWFNAEQPKADETISSWVGRRAIAGAKWALIAEKVIDAFMDKGHCRDAAAKEAEDLDD